MAEEEIISLIIIGLFIPFIAGIICGLKGKITVFRNYEDIWLVFLAAVLPLVLMFLCASIPGSLMIAASCAAELLLLGVIFYRTYEDNRNIFYTLSALYTKIPLCISALALIISFFEDRSRRHTSFLNVIAALLLLPLIIKLTKNKNGLLKERNYYV